MSRVQPCIAIACEFASINGGEASLIAVLRSLAKDVRPVILGPPLGPLADNVRSNGWELVPLVTREHGVRVSVDELHARLARNLSIVRPQLVHANSLSMCRPVGVVAAKLGLPASGHVRDMMRLSRAAISDLNQYQQLIAVSRATRTYHIEQGLDPTRIRVVYNGIEGGFWRPMAGHTTPLRCEFGWPADDFVILSVGQIALRKGHDVLAEMLTSHRPERTRLLIVGERHSRKPETVEYEDQLRRAVETDDLGRLLGRRTDMRRLYSEADLLVHAAHQEPLGRVLLEAAACELPTVATDVGGTSEILDDGVTGRVVSDSDAMFRAIMELRHDPAKRERYGRRARCSILRRFNVQSAAASTLRFWRDVMT